MLSAGIVAGGIIIGYAIYRLVSPSREQSPPHVESAAPQELQMSSVEAVEDQERLKKSYDAMEERFSAQNLNTEFIASIVKYYVDKTSAAGATDGRLLCEARSYVEVDGAESENMCRLIVLPMTPDPQIAHRLYDASTKALDILPRDIRVFHLPAEMLHITLFHTSRVESPSPARQEGHPSQIALADAIEKEKEDLTQIIKTSPGPCLVFNRVILADSGVLLALWTDMTTALMDIRKKFRERCPNAPTKQTNIVHTTLLRILTPKTLSAEVQSQMQAVCGSLTRDLSGMTWTPTIARVVNEMHFSTIAGPSVDVPLLKTSTV